MMTKRQQYVTAELHEADKHLRNALVAAATINMILVKDAITDAEWFLDEALAKVAWYPQTENNVKKVVDKKKKICHNGSRKI